MLRVLLLLASAGAIAGCAGSSNDDTQATKPAAQAQAASPQPTVLDPQLKALQKAKDVQKTVDDAAKATDKAVDDNGG